MWDHKIGPHLIVSLWMYLDEDDQIHITTLQWRRVSSQPESQKLCIIGFLCRESTRSVASHPEGPVITFPCNDAIMEIL